MNKHSGIQGGNSPLYANYYDLRKVNKNRMLSHVTLHSALHFENLATCHVGLTSSLDAGLFVGLVLLDFRKNCSFFALLFKAFQQNVEGLVFFSYDCRQTNHHLFYRFSFHYFERLFIVNRKVRQATADSYRCTGVSPMSKLKPLSHFTPTKSRVWGANRAFYQL